MGVQNLENRQNHCFSQLSCIIIVGLKMLLFRTNGYVGRGQCGRVVEGGMCSVVPRFSLFSFFPSGDKGREAHGRRSTMKMSRRTLRFCAGNGPCKSRTGFHAGPSGWCFFFFYINLFPREYGAKQTANTSLYIIYNIIRSRRSTVCET